MRKQNYLGNYYGDKFHDGYDGAVYDPKGITPTLRARNGGGVLIADRRTYGKRDNNAKKDWRII